MEFIMNIHCFYMKSKTKLIEKEANYMDNTRVVSFLNDTADQQEKLETVIHNLKANPTEQEKKKIEEYVLRNSNDLPKSEKVKIAIGEIARDELSKWGLIHFKLQVLMLGKVVLSDSHIWNNFFLHGLDDEEYDSFVDFVTTHRIIEARCRPISIPSVFTKTPNIRNYWSKELNEAVNRYNANYNEIINEYGNILTAKRYFKILEKSGYKFSSAPDFKIYQEKISRYDDFYNLLSQCGLVKFWKPMVNDDLFLSLKEPKNGENIYDKIDALRNLSGANTEAIAKLRTYVENAEVYNGSDLERHCRLVNENVEKSLRFFFNEFHREVFCRGLAIQHECGFMQLRDDGYIPDEKEVKLFITSDERKKLCRMTWEEISRWFGNPKFRDTQDKLINSLQNPTKNSIYKENLFKNLLSIIGIKSELEKGNGDDSNPDPVTASSLLDIPTKLYVADAQDKLQGMITIKI